MTCAQVAGRRQRPAVAMSWAGACAVAAVADIAAVASGVPAAYGAVLRQLTEAISSGDGSRPNDVVESVTGAPPRTFAQFAAAAAVDWCEPVASR